MSEFREDMEEYFGKRAFKVVSVVLILCAIWIISALVLGMWPFSVVSGIAGKVVNENSIIQNYQWFYDQYGAIQAQKANYEAAPEGAYEKNGMRNVLNNSIAEYNSRSRQVTRNLWKAKDLPYQIELVGGSK